MLIRVFFNGPKRARREGAPPLEIPEARGKVKSRARLASLPFQIQRSLGASGGPSDHLNHDHGSQTRIFNTSSFVSPSLLECCFQQKQSGSNKTLLTRLDQKRCNEANKGSSTSVLFSPVCGSQGREQGQSYHRLVCPEQILDRSIIQDGDSFENIPDYSRLPVGLQNRAQGRLLGLHKDHQTGQGLPSQDVFKSLFFPGRLSSSSRIPGRAEQNVSPGVNPVQRSRVFSQQG